MAVSMLWFRRDLRLADNPALWVTTDEGDQVVALFVLDNRLLRPSGANRRLSPPFFRIFHPIVQSRRWDPDGDYLRRFLPELRALTGPAIHEPWGRADYPSPIVDHALEREESLARYREASASRHGGP